MTARRRDAWVGLALCLAFCVAGVAARGLRWDETLEHAQALAGTVVYPAGHPLPHYLARAYSLQTLVSAGMLLGGLGDAAVCALRNLLFLCATVLPVYALLLALRCGAMAGCAGALLLAQGLLLEFDGNYPLQVWPELYSNGHVGTGWVVLTLAALAAPWPRTAMLLLGLLPGVHAGQAPLACAVAAGLLLSRSPEARPLRAAWPWLLAGLGLVALGWFAYRATTGALPPAAWPASDADALWRAYTFGHDPHRQIPRAAAWFTVLAAAGMTAWAWRAEGAWRHRVLCGYAGAVAVVLLATGAAHGLMGVSTPSWLVQWMPYRLVNHAAPLLFATALAGLCSTGGDRRSAPWLAVALLAWGAATPYLAPLFSERVYTRYVAPGEAAAFVLVGAGWARWILGSGLARLQTTLALALLPLAALSFHRFGAACLVLGFAVAGLSRRHAPPRPVPGGRGAWVQAAICMLAALQVLSNQAQARAWLPRTAFESMVTRTLSGEPAARRVVLAPPGGHGIQARLGAAVMTDAATLSLISYVPAVAAAVNGINAECHGADLLRGDSGPGWQAHWASLQLADWRALAARHGFAYVVAPADLALRLPPPILRTPEACLYRVD